MLIVFTIAVSWIFTKMLNEKIERIIPGILSGMLVLEYGTRRLGLLEYYGLFKIVAALISIILCLSVSRNIKSVVWELLSSPAAMAWILSGVCLWIYYTLANADSAAIFDKNIIIMGFMLIMVDSIRLGKYKSLIVGVLMAIVIFLTAIENEFVSDSRYILSGFVVSCLFLTAYKYYVSKKKIYLFNACLHFMAIFTTGRMSILLGGALLVAVLIACFLSLVDKETLNKKDSVRSIVFAVALCALMAIIAISSHYMISGDLFKRDVLFTYLGSVFSLRRYSFDLFIHIPISYFLILSIIAFVIVEICYKENKTKFFWVMNAGIVVYTIVLGVLYVEILAHINFQNGEYLTGFEQYIQMPVVMVLTFWGCFINGFFEKEMSS